jgi:hypothetical protein
MAALNCVSSRRRSCSHSICWCSTAIPSVPMSFTKRVFCAPSPPCWTRYRRTPYFRRRRKYAVATLGARWSILPGFWVWQRCNRLPTNSCATNIG